MTHSALEANQAVALSATPRHTEGGNSMHTNDIAACIARDLHTVLTRRTHTPISDQSNNTAASQPASRVAVSDDII
eukprot:COSAG06_NODE_13754_length_1222_cov_20.349955_2_plen_76_part_00